MHITNVVKCILGVIEVEFQEDSDGYITLVALPEKSKKVLRADSPGSSPGSSGEGAQSDSDSESQPTPNKQR